MRSDHAECGNRKRVEEWGTDMTRAGRGPCAFVLASALACAVSGCARKEGPGATRYEVVRDSIAGVFGVTVPPETREIAIYRDTWQAHGMYAYFEVPSDKLDLIKTGKHWWIEIPVQYRTSPLSTPGSNSQDPNDAQWSFFISSARSQVARFTEQLRIANPQRACIRWVHDDFGWPTVVGAPEKHQVMMISDEGDGVHGCYLADTDIRNYGQQGRLYDVIAPEKPVRVRKPSE